VTHRQSPSKTAPTDRIPRSITLRKKRSATEVPAIGKPELAVATGDPTDNQKSYHSDGVGDWQMGTKIAIRPNVLPGRECFQPVAP